ncbi:uncharacterized protein LOC109601443 isoform X2 [Aethina tumida]|uniref:uncharacterized protein LOC126264182 isoform X2 n=1 Tax=Aethina tumida TaxID=116153 RepID=UPI00096B5B9D|nr:uncharacterized protein LOC126264182 isoform X2 [Aethina tumida]XP_049817110.1 uncharacterized protein LOC109601443 isoform X2 [Aethina tumida]
MSYQNSSKPPKFEPKRKHAKLTKKSSIKTTKSAFENGPKKSKKLERDSKPSRPNETVQSNVEKKLCKRHENVSKLNSSGPLNLINLDTKCPVCQDILRLSKFNFEENSKENVKKDSIQVQLTSDFTTTVLKTGNNILSKNYIPKFELSTTDEKNAKAVYETKIAEISDLLNKHVDRLRDKSPIATSGGQRNSLKEDKFEEIAENKENLGKTLKKSENFIDKVDSTYLEKLQDIRKRYEETMRLLDEWAAKKKQAQNFFCVPNKSVEQMKQDVLNFERKANDEKIYQRQTSVTVNEETTMISNEESFEYIDDQIWEYLTQRYRNRDKNVVT